MTLILVLVGFTAIGLIGFWIGLKIGASFGFEEGVEFGKKSERRFADHKQTPRAIQV